MKRPLLYLSVFLLLIWHSESFAQYALEFNGDSDYVALNGQDFAPPWTMEVMVGKSETDNYQHLLTGIDGNSGIRIEQWWGIKVGYTLSGVANYTFNYSLPLNQWVHLAMVNNGTSTTLYADGVSKGTISSSINMPLKWISKNTDDASMKAKIDELRIWNTNLTQEIIEQYMGQGVGPSHPNYDDLKHYYKFDEGSGNVCYDSKGNLNGTIYGAVYYIETDWDAMVNKLVNPENTTDNFSGNELITMQVKNNGLLDIDVDFEVGYIMDGAGPVVQTINASVNPIPASQTIDIDFPPIDLNTSGSYQFKFYTALPNDENPSNDTMNVTLVSVSEVVGNITNFEADENEYIFTCGQDKVKVIFYKPDMFRIWLGVNGNFPNPTGNLIIESLDYPPMTSQWSDEGDHYLLESDSVSLRAYKQPLRFELYKKDNQTLIWEETSGLDYGTRTFQELSRHDDEYFYGGGMQNGYFSHRGKVIKISKEISNWDDGAVPNPVPFYMSTNGYGAMRHTFAPGEYDFRQPVLTSHNEQRFDCFYFVGDDLKQILNLYTELTGRPTLPPRWGLELGDADCYNDEGQTTPVVIEEIADKYREYDLPGGWILPNDGYGCGYTELPYVVEQLHERGFYTGLWTENGVGQIAWEVGTAGTRACKLDVAWVGSGYQYALNACKQAYNGIEDNCNERAFVWSVCGWAGTQRYSVVWSGDQSGNWEYIRFHIPTIIGSGLSGFNLASSDLDGIFGGTAQSYTRDLQWKTFIPTTYAMSGWASNNKQPWVYGQTFTDINRKYLKLKMRLTPYMYTYCNEAYETGVPAVRAMVLEYPDNPVCWDTDTRYQFMSGENFLVAPVYKYSTKRDSIYFPGGVWYDYWSGEQHAGGPHWLNDYPISLDKIPVFVKEGSIIPMYPEMLYDREKPKDPIAFLIYPEGYSSFELYEDDGISRAHREGAFSKTLIECNVSWGMEPVTITVNESVGDFEGKLDFRANRFEVHCYAAPTMVLLDWIPLNQFNTIEELELALDGWVYDPDDRGGFVHIKTQPLSTDESFVVEIDYPVGTWDFNIEGQIKVFPNPSTGIIQLELPDGKKSEIKIFNAEGKLLTTFNSNPAGGNTAIFDLSAEPDGVYFLQIKSGNQVYGKKVTLAR